MKKIIFVLIAIILTMLYGCSGAKEMQSGFAPGGVPLDGNLKAWNEHMHVVPEQNIAFGFMNDADNMYICMVTRDRAKLMKIFTGGLTLWLESGNEKIGLRYPDKVQPGEFMNARNRPDENDEPRSGGRRGDRFKKIIESQTDITILDKNEKQVFTALADGSSGLKARLDIDEDQFVYQLRIPLNGSGNAPYSLSARPDEKVALNFVTGKFERPERGAGERMRPDREGGPGGTGRPGGRGGIGGGEGRERGEFNTEPLNYKFEVKLGRQP